MPALRTIYYAMPPFLRRFSRRIWYLPVDLFEKLAGKRPPLVPPRGRIFIGSGDFLATGNSIRDQVVQMTRLETDHRVLDVGCGMGRVAVPLANFLHWTGSYEGFDIVKPAIRWCRRTIAREHKNFRFTYVPLKNSLYNLRTSKRAGDFIFPYLDNEFDVVVATSVFTHMVLPDVENYLFQIHRVLKKGGACFATFFLINPEARKYMGQSGKPWFHTERNHHYLFHPRVKEANVAYDEDYLLKLMIGSRGYHVEQVWYGFWPGRPKTEWENFQDIVVFRKT